MYQKSQKGQHGFKARSLGEFLEICNRNFIGTTVHLIWPEIEYKNSSSFITVFCFKHKNVYSKRAVELQKGAGCPDCGRERMYREKKVKSNLEKIEAAKEKFDNKFDYSKFDLETANKESSVIVCPVHGEIEMSFPVHLKGSYGCRQCYYRDRNAVSSYKEFFVKAKEVKENFDEIDCSKFEYNGALNKSTFKCKIHNLWYEQTPCGFLSGKNGCPECKSVMLSAGSAAFNNFKDLIKKPKQAYRPCYVYAAFIEYYDCEDNQRLKVGISNVDCIEKRMATIKREFGCDCVTVIKALKSTRIDCVVIEEHIHKSLADYKLPIQELSEKRAAGRTELFDCFQIDTISLAWKDLAEIYNTTEEVNYYDHHS